MIAFPASGWCRHMWAVCGLLAIMSVALVIVVGCASGAAEPQTLSGGVTVHNYNLGGTTEAAGARFFYSDVKDDPGTPWNESRTVWCDEASPKEAIGMIGLETMGVFFERESAPEKGEADPGWVKLRAFSAVFICNQWGGHPITITGGKLPDEELHWELPTPNELLTAPMYGSGGDVMYDWLANGPGYYPAGAKWLYPDWPITTEAQVQETWTKALGLAFNPGGSDPPWPDGTRPEIITEMKFDAAPLLESPTIAPGEKSKAQVDVAFEYYVEAPEGDPNGYTAPRLIALAFATYFGAHIDFTY